MSYLLDPLDPERANLTDKEIFIKIWSKPRLVLKYINDHEYDKFEKPLLILSGITRFFDRAAERNMGDDMQMWSILGYCIILGGLLGWIAFYLYAALVSWAGGLFKGRGDTASLLRIFAYAMIPANVGLLFIVPQIGIYGIEMFKSDGDITSAGWIDNIIFYASAVFQFVLTLWSIALVIIGVSEVQKLPIGKSILNLFFPIIVVLVPILLVVLLAS